MEEQKPQKVEYREVRQVILKCEINKDSQECIDGKKRLNIKDEN